MTNNDQIIIDKLYNKLLPSINKIYTTYNYLNISKKEYEIIIKKFLLDAYIKSNNQKADNNFYIKNIKENLEIYIKNILKNKEKISIIINNYINNNLSVKQTQEENIKELRKLSRFIKKYDLILTPDMYIEFINSNKIFLSIIKEIIDKNIDLIKEKGIEFIDDDINVISLLDIYCMINNIKSQTYENIKLDIEEENYDELVKDSLKLYLNEIKLPVLTAEEEYELSKRKSLGDMSARNKLIEHNLKFVVCIAKRYLGRGLDFQELIQEGNTGLIIAIDKFDHTKGYRVSTYSYHWIRQAITKAIVEKSKMIKLPIYLDEKIRRYKQIINNLEQKLNRTATKKEISEELNISLEEVNKIYMYLQDITSLNTKIDNGDNTELEIFAASEEEDPEKKYIKNHLTEEIKEIFKRCYLDEKEIAVLLLRNGFYGEIFTLAKTGEIMGGLTRERIRQIESKALQKIRTSSYINELFEYAENPSQALKNIQSFRTFYQQNQKTTRNFKKIESVKTIDSKETIIDATKEQEQTKLTIFDKFTEQGYTKEEVLSVLPLLPTQDKKRVLLRNGTDLDNPVVSEQIREKDRKLYITLTLPRIKKLLKENYGNKTKKYQRIRKKQ